MSQTLFQKYGGFATVSRIVMDFYDRALESDQIGDYFENVEMTRLVDHQTKFVASLLGGPASYTDRQLGQLHHHLAISDADFDEMSSVLADCLSDHGMAAEDVSAVAAAIEARRGVIVARSAA
ncbi:MAG: group 1 truncated hemoglobin [Pseudomonadota bacterium]